MTAKAKLLPAASGSITRWTPVSRVGTGAALVLVGVLGALPYLVNLSIIYAMVTLFIFVILASMWNLLAGYGGMVSVGQQAYIGVGAYSLVALADQLGVNIFLSIPIAALLCALVSVPVSFLAFRLVGGYFAVGTWVIAEVFRLLAIQIPAIGGGSGISLAAMAPFGRDLRIAVSYWVALGCAALAILVCVLLIRSRYGLALTAVRDDPVAAATSGVDVNVTKRLVFVIAAAGTGMAGALMAISTLRVQPDGVFSVQWSAFMIFIVVVGGVGTIEGPLIGATIFWLLQQTLAAYDSLYLVIIGLIGVAFVLFVRRGVWGLFSRTRRREIFPTGYQLKSLNKTQRRTE